MKKEYRMTQEDMNVILEAGQPAVCIALQCGAPQSRQEKANAAWAKLGEKMGFQPFTVRPSPKGELFFTAEEVKDDTE